MNDEQYLLASAYLDGELTADERVAAEADPAVMRAVDDLRALQAGVAESEAPAPAARAAALAAAMDVFDRVHSVPPMAVRRTVDWGRYLSIAAAVLVIGVLGVVIATAVGGRGGDDDDAAEVAPDVEASAHLDSAAAGQSVSDAAAGTVPPAAAESMAEGTEAATEGDITMAAPAGTEAPAATALASDAGGRSAAVEPVSDPDAVVTSPSQLTGLGMLLLEQARTGALGPTPETACTFAEAASKVPTTPGTAAVDPANVQVLADGRYDFGGSVGDVLVFVEQTTGQGFAVDPHECVLLVAGVVP